METNKFNHYLKLNKRLLAYFVLGALVIALIVSLVQPFKYDSQTRLLVMLENSSPTDASAISRPNQYLSGLLSKVAYSGSFYNEVLNIDPNIDRAYFGATDKEQLKTWQKTISAVPVNDLGIIDLNVYHTDKAQALEIAQAINQVMITKNNLYHGLGNQVKIVVIDQPITSAYPVKPNLLLNLGLALILGLAVGLAYIYIKSETASQIIEPKELASEPAIVEPANAVSDYWGLVEDQAKYWQSAPTAEPVANVEQPLTAEPPLAAPQEMPVGQAINFERFNPYV